MPAVPKAAPGLDRRAKQQAFVAALEAAYAVAEALDGHRCFVTGTRLFKQAFGRADELLTHHHLQARSLSKARRTDPENIVCVSLAVHRYLTSGALHLLDTHGRKALTRDTVAYAEWNPTRVPKGSEPFALRPALRKTLANRSRAK